MICIESAWIDPKGPTSHEDADRQLRLDRSPARRGTRETAIFKTLLEALDPRPAHTGREPTADLLVGDLVLCEILRGIPDEREHAAVKDVLLSFELVRIGGVELALEAADHYRALRRIGVTVRKTIDLLIGTWCIAGNCALLHSDRDFDPMAQHLGLRVL